MRIAHPEAFSPRSNLDVFFVIATVRLNNQFDIVLYSSASSFPPRCKGSAFHKKGPAEADPVFAKDGWCWLFVVVNARRDHAVGAGVNEDETAHAHGVGVHGCDLQVSAAHD